MITYLLTTADSLAGTERAALSQIKSFVKNGQEVEVVSIYRGDGSMEKVLPQGVKIKYLVDAESDLTGGIDDEKANEIFDKPSLLVPVEWDDQFTLLTDRVIRREFPSIKSEHIMSLTPALGYLASLFCNPESHIIAQEHRSSRQRGRGITPLKVAADNISAIVALNDEDAEWLRTEFTPGTSVDVWSIPNSVEVDGIPQSDLKSKYVIAAGRLSRAKQFDHLIRAFSGLSEDFNDWKLRIYGDGPDQKRLMSLCRDLNMGNRVEILPFVEDLSKEWAKGSIHAMASRSEGQSLVLMEAAVAGIPTVAYDCPTGPRNLIKNNEDGILVHLNDVNSMTIALERLMKNESLRVEMGTKAKKSFQRFSPENIHEMWHSKLTKLSQETDGRGRVEFSEQKQINKLAPADEDGLEIIQPNESKKSKAIKIADLEDMTLSKISEENRELVLGELSFKSIPWRNLIHLNFYKNSVAIPEDRKWEVVDALMNLAKDPESEGLTVRFMKGNNNVGSQDWYPTEQPNRHDLEDADILRVYRYMTDKNGLKSIGSAGAIDLEFWSKETEDGPYVPSRPNRSIDAIYDWDYNDDRKLWSEIDFPIDVVYTWVDDTDPEWVKSKSIHKGEKADDLATGSMRFRNRDELKYSIRSIREYAPWVRNIFIVTDNQTPKWLSMESDIKVVSHYDLFPDTSVLPVFNSHAIESVLHRIPGLAEHFLYFNDDTVLMRPQAPYTYFEANGQPKFFPSSVKLPEGCQNPEPHMFAALNNQKIIFEMFGKKINQSMLHTPHAHLKSVLAELESKIPEKFDQVRASRFRSETDISILSSLAQYYGFLTSRYTTGNINYTYCPIGLNKTVHQMGSLLNTGRYDVLTLGETTDPEIDIDRTDYLVDRFFNLKFPIPAKDEK